MKKMRSLVLLFVLASVGSLYAQRTATLTLTGRVTASVGIRSTITQSPIFNVETIRNVDLGTITVFSNTTSPWTITIASSNGGIMRGSSTANPDVVPYRFRFGNSVFTNLSDIYSLTFSNRTVFGGLDFPIGVELDNENGDPKFSDTYTDTVTITIAVS